jgi:hypothetical protein
MIKIENPTYMWTTLLTQIEIEFHLNNAALGVENPFAPLTFPVPARPTSSPGPLGLSSHPKRLQYNSAWHCQALDRSNRAIDQLASVSCPWSAGREVGLKKSAIRYTVSS